MPASDPSSPSAARPGFARVTATEPPGLQPGLAIAGAPRPPLAELPAASARILVAQADARAAARLASRLYRLGHGVTFASNAFEVVSQLRVSRFDLVIAHVDLPQGADLRWVERLIQTVGHVEIALLYARPSLSLAIWAANLPLAGCFADPLTEGDLELLLQRTIARARRD